MHKISELAAKYIDRLSYSSFWISPEGEYLFFLKNCNSGKHLHFLDLGKFTELLFATQVSTIDFSSRSFSPFDFDLSSKKIYFISDEQNRENYNVFSISILELNSFEKITNATYCSQYQFFSDFQELLYVDRYKIDGGLFSSRLHRLNLTSGLNTIILDDADWEYKLSWGDLVVTPDLSKVIISVNQGATRNKYNLILVDLNKNKGDFYKLLPESEETNELYAVTIGKADSSIYYCTNISGYLSICKFDLNDAKLTTAFQCNRSDRGVGIVKIDNKLWFVALLRNDEADSTELVLKSLTNDDNRSWTLSGNFSLFSHESLWLIEERLDLPPRLVEPNIEVTDWFPLRTILLFDGPSEEIVCARYQYLTYRSFDGLEIPSFLLLPKKKLRGVLIAAFYGGENRYNYQNHLYAELGIACFSPAVRGSWDRGKAWQCMIHGDLGGNEILDVIWAARFLEEKLQLSPTKIGLTGASHGGYSVLRSLTMPDNFKGQDSRYPFAFGICWAGFADLLLFHSDSNIPDWLSLFLGPIESNLDKYIDRSPITHFKNLQSPLYIRHGGNDCRVPISTMQKFIDQLSASKIPHYIEVDKGQGHSLPKRDEQIAAIENELRFILKYTSL